MGDAQYLTAGTLLKSLDVRRRTLAPHSGEAARSRASGITLPFGWKQPGSESIASLFYCCTLFTPPISLLDICFSFNPLRDTTHTTFTCRPSSISLFISPRLGLVIAGVTRFRPSRLPARFPAYTRLGYCHSTRPPQHHHPRVPWPYSFTTTVMSSSEDDQPLVKGTSRAFIICLGDAALQSVSQFAF
jgi:hypothetical protein